MTSLRTDYLVVGAGAMGLALSDVLLSETDATLTLVDRHDRPGGHWNDAYPFVHLHQPSAFYGVNSAELSSGRVDDRGGNAGLAELASGTEVISYFERLMNERLLPSDRVTYLPMHDQGEGRATSLLTGTSTDIDVGTRTIDCTYMNVRVPSIAGPSYVVDPGVTCIPPNDLPRRAPDAERFVVIGAGKTSMDACLWLLDHGVDPDRITWIRPRDSWMLDRANIQPGRGDAGLRSLAAQFELAANATTVDGLFDGLEQSGELLRLDPDVRPTMYRCATVTEIELDSLRRVTDVVRLGHVKHLTETAVEFDGDTMPTTPRTVFVDCSADGLARRPPVDVFSDGHITAQAVRTCQQVFSAAFIGHVEAAYDDDDTKNDLCRPVPHPDDDIDWLRSTLGQLTNQIRWMQDPALSDWLASSRLDPFSSPPTADGRPDAEIAGKLATHVFGAIENLQRLIDEHPDPR